MDVSVAMSNSYNYRQGRNQKFISGGGGVFFPFLFLPFLPFVSHSFLPFPSLSPVVKWPLESCQGIRGDLWERCIPTGETIFATTCTKMARNIYISFVDNSVLFPTVKDFFKISIQLMKLLQKVRHHVF